MKRRLGPLLIALIGATFAPCDTFAGEWGVGVGVARYQPPQQGAAPELVAGPFPFYTGERLSVSFGGASYALVSSDRFRLALEGQGRFDGYDPKKSDQLAGMGRRNPAFDMGFSISTVGLWGQAQFKILSDVTGTHKGYEVSATYQIPYATGRWTLTPSLGVNWSSKNLVDYYHGVREGESQADRPRYEGRSGINASISLGADYKLSDHWHVAGGAELVYLGDSIKDSPIIEKNHETSVFSALIYRF